MKVFNYKRNIFLTTISLAFVFASCNSIGGGNRIRACVDENKQTLSFDKMKDIDFDSVVFIQPYTGHDRLKQHTGIDLKRNDIESRDDIFLLVFLKGRNIIEIDDIDRDEFDCDIDTLMVFPKNYKFKLVHPSPYLMVIKH